MSSTGEDYFQVIGELPPHAAADKNHMLILPMKGASYM